MALNASVDSSGSKEIQHCRRKYSDGSWRSHVYWAPTYAPPFPLGRNDAAERIWAAVQGSVRERIGAGGRIGIIMSGGVDSSATAALLLERGFDVVGVTLKLWPQDCVSRAEDKCCGRWSPDGGFFVFLAGPVTRGSRRWIEVGFFRFQPSEFGKLLFVIALAGFIADRSRRVNEPRTSLTVMR